MENIWSVGRTNTKDVVIYHGSEIPFDLDPVSITQRQCDAITPQEALTGFTLVRRTKPGDVDKIPTVGKEIRPGVWVVRWVIPNQKQLDERRKLNEVRYRLRSKTAAAVVKVRCCNQLHTVAVVGKALVLCNHPKHERKAEEAVANLGLFEHGKCPCLQILDIWQNYDNLKCAGRKLPAELNRLRHASPMSAKGRVVGSRRGRPIKMGNYEKAAPDTSTNEQRRARLRHDAVKRKINAIAAKLNPKYRTEELGITSVYSLDGANTDGYNGVRLRPRSYLINVVARGITHLDGHLILDAKWVTNDTAFVRAVHIQELGHSYKAKDAVIIVKDNKPTLYTVDKGTTDD